MITVLLLLAAVGILAWGFIQAKPFGTSGILAWLQTVILMGPWLLFFGLSAVGVYLNLAGILLLVVVSAGSYIFLGRRPREIGQAEVSEKQATALMDKVAEPPATATTSEIPLDESVNLAESKQAAEESSSPIATAETTDEYFATEPSEEDLPAIPVEDLAVIEGIFGSDTFFRTKSVPYQEGAIFKGNLRGQPDQTAQVLSEKLADKLGDRYCSFLLADPDNKPVVVVLPSSNGPKPTSSAQKGLAVVLAIATFATCLETASLLQRFDIFQSPERWPEALPIALGITAVLAAHEIGHWVIAGRRQVKISPPFFLPAWQLGAFGSLMRFESILPNRSVLFDVSFAGPAAGGILSFVFLFVGLVISHPGSLFQLPAQFFQSSILVGVLARIVLGDALHADLVDVHPLMMVGWLGLIITAINVMPAGQLDGGRMVQAIYGRKTLTRTTTVTILVLVLVGLLNPLALYWAVLIVFLQRQPERPCTDDLSEPNDTRAALALLALFVMLLVLLPLTPTLAGRLGIG